jgi:hypothetical protein
LLTLSKEVKEKLTRYFLNADPFLWNVLEGKKKKNRIQELQALGFIKGYSRDSNVSYDRINQDLLIELGIEVILERIVIRRVHNVFTADTLQYLHRCWERGQTPTLEYLRKQGLYQTHPLTSNEVRDELGIQPVAGYKEPAFIFVQINTQYNFIERWTVFAGLWFEEIEPLLGPEIRN